MTARSWGFAVLVVALGALTAGKRMSAAEDPAAASKLLEAGKQALKKHDYALAAIQLDEAYAASSKQIEALYLAGTAYEKIDDDPAAYLSYRAFVKAFDEYPGPDALPASFASLRRKAASRLKSLEPATFELDALCQEHVEELLAFAEAQVADAPDVAYRALQLAREIAPDTEGVERRLKSLRPRVEAPPDRVVSPFEDAVAGWTDLLWKHTLGDNEGWTYTDAGLTIDYRAGTLVSPKDVSIQSSTRYVLEFEGRMKKAHAATCSMGLVFGRQGNDCYVMTLSPAGAQLNVLRSMVPTPLVGAAKTLMRPDVWHRLSVKVDGKSVEIWIDGERFLTPEPSTLKYTTQGRYGIIYQDAVLELRELRIGDLR